MEESTTDIIGIFAAVALMFLVPLVLLADRNDDISQLIANSATSSFVENIIKTGTITSEDYANYINQLNGYKKYIENKTKKHVNTYLYSILGEKIEKISC